MVSSLRLLGEEAGERRRKNSIEEKKKKEEKCGKWLVPFVWEKEEVVGGGTLARKGSENLKDVRDSFFFFFFLFLNALHVSKEEGRGHDVSPPHSKWVSLNKVSDPCVPWYPSFLTTTKYQIYRLTLHHLHTYTIPLSESRSPVTRDSCSTATRTIFFLFLPLAFFS